MLERALGLLWSNMHAYEIMRLKEQYHVSEKYPSRTTKEEFRHAACVLRQVLGDRYKAKAVNMEYKADKDAKEQFLREYGQKYCPEIKNYYDL